MRFVVLTGLSGAGKTTGLHALEDLGYFAADNVPPALWSALVALARRGRQSQLAVGVDVRTRDFLPGISDALQQLANQDIHPEIVFLDASDEVLVQRYNLTRRTHPLGQSALASDIARERETLGELRAMADMVLDTTNLSARQLVDELRERYGEDRSFRLRLMSFGFKRGVPIDADNVFDLRSLPNPNYHPDLHHKDGRDTDVQNYVLTADTMQFYAPLREFVRLLAGQALAAGRSSYTVALGCTGGQHRSVAVAERLSFDLASSFATRVEHRDLEVALAEGVQEGAHG